MDDERRFSDSVHIDASPEAVYDLVTDIARTGEWSPICQYCAWNPPDDGPRVGATFSGHNVTPDRVWDTTSEVTAAERGVEFAWSVGPGAAQWRYTLAAEDGGTRLTESWFFGSGGWALFHERYGDEAGAQAQNRTDAAHAGIPASLAAIKKIAEAG